jgi:hypothetical protein
VKRNRCTVLVPAFASLIGGAACGAGVQNPGAQVRSPLEALNAAGHASTTSEIGLADLRKVQGTTAADAVRQLRPEFMRGGRRTNDASPPTPSVYVDGRHAGGVDVLSLIPLTPVVGILYLDAVAAKSLFGSYCPCEGGVVYVRTKSRRDLSEQVAK